MLSNPTRVKGRVTAALVAAAGTAVTSMAFSAATADAAFSVFDANIPQLESALSTGATTDVDVVQQYLNRINIYNKAGGGDGTLGGGGRGLNAVAQVSPTVLADAARVDTMIRNGATTAQFPLLGVPVLVKNSYDVAGLTTTNGVSVLNGSGTPGSTTIIAKTDAPSIAALKAQGAIIIGKSALSTMAYSYDGIDNAAGVVTNPYNQQRQPGGSSSGIGVGITAQFAMLGMGGETGGSIRVPSTYNALVGLKTSAGVISPNGTWPLTPSRDVVGPIAKTVTDIAYAMNALVTPTTDNIWRSTPFYPTGGAQPGVIGTGLGEGTDPSSKGLTAVTGTRPADYTTFLKSNALAGKTFAIENDIIPFNASNSATTLAAAFDGTVNTNVYSNFQKAVAVLQAQGATIKYVDLPASVTYYNTLGRTTARGGAATTAGFNTPSGTVIPYPTLAGTTTPASAFNNYAAAYYYNQQIVREGDPVVKNIDDFRTALYGGLPKDANGNPTNVSTGSVAGSGAGSRYSTLISAYNNIVALADIYDKGLAAGFGDNNNDGVLDNPDANTALQAFTTLRQTAVDDFLTANGIDAIIAPTMGSIAPMVSTALGGSTTDPFSNGTASLIGRFEGNILGLPSLSVPDGYVADGSAVGSPTAIQFMGRLDGEGPLLGYGYGFEQATAGTGLGRIDPNLTFVPEPASVSVLVVAAGFAIGRRRRRSPLN